MTKRSQVVGVCPDCGRQFVSMNGFKGHVGTTRCPSYSHEEEQPEPVQTQDVGVGESSNWRRNRVTSSGQNFFVRR